MVDFKGDLDDDAVTVDRLIGFFEWLRANRWTTISLDDVDAARRGKKALPERSILITFDDGYRSFYTRVFPLVLAYRVPIVVALVGSWVEAPAGSKVSYGKEQVPRERFLSWEEAREMARSGLVEFASHSYDLHRGVLGNPQGNEMAAANTRIYTPGRGYETEQIPAYEMVPDEAVELIHQELLSILEEVGCEFRDDEAIALWKAAGADVSEHASASIERC